MFLSFVCLVFTPMHLRISAEVRICSRSTVTKELEEQPGGQGNQIASFTRVGCPASLEALGFVAVPNGQKEQ